MKHNRSLKDIFVPKAHLKEKEEAESIWSPRNFKPDNGSLLSTKADYKSMKNTQSQKNLFNINPINPSISSIASPKYFIHQNAGPVNVLTPANKNISVQ